MKTTHLRTFLVGLCLTAAPIASAEEPKAGETSMPSKTPSDTMPTDTTMKDGTATGSKDTMPSKQAHDAKAKSKYKDGAKLDTAQVMKISQTAMTHIAAAQVALDDGKKAAAKSALAKSKQALGKLYDTPPVTALMNEFDEALNAVTGEGPTLKALDLAPLSASIVSYQAYLDPEVAAGVKQAEESAKRGDAKATEDALRLARNRVSIDLAMLPVEEAYVRVLAAQQAVQTGDLKGASRILRDLPIVVGEVQISQPLVPARFKLQAAAEAAEAKEWERSRGLLKEANQAIQQVETSAQNTELKAELTPIADDLERLSQQAQSGTNPAPQQIREIARRARSVGTSADEG